MTDPVVQIQVDPTNAPSTPTWFGEVAVMAYALQRYGLLKAIEQRVRFVRARMGKYELLDVVAMLIGYAVSGERTLQAFCERVQPFAAIESHHLPLDRHLHYGSPLTEMPW